MCHTQPRALLKAEPWAEGGGYSTSYQTFGEAAGGKGDDDQIIKGEVEHSSPCKEDKNGSPTSQG